MALTILLWALFICLSLVVVALLMPLRIEVSLDKTDRWRCVFALRAFGRFGPRVRMQGRKTPKEAQAKPLDEKASKGRFAKRLNATEFAGAALRLFADLLRCVRFDMASIHIRFGTGDPAETGHIFGMLAPLIYGMAGNSRTQFRVCPDFDSAVFTGHGQVVLSVIPASLLAPFVRFGWTAFGARP